MGHEYREQVGVQLSEIEPKTQESNLLCYPIKLAQTVPSSGLKPKWPQIFRNCHFYQILFTTKACWKLSINGKITIMRFKDLSTNIFRGSCPFFLFYTCLCINHGPKVNENFHAAKSTGLSRKNYIFHLKYCPFKYSAIINLCFKLEWSYTSGNLHYKRREQFSDKRACFTTLPLTFYHLHSSLHRICEAGIMNSRKK